MMFMCCVLPFIMISYFFRTYQINHRAKNVISIIINNTVMAPRPQTRLKDHNFFLYKDVPSSLPSDGSLPTHEDADKQMELFKEVSKASGRKSRGRRRKFRGRRRRWPVSQLLMILFEFWLFCKVSLKLISINWKEISDNLFLPRGYFMQFNTGQTEQQYVGFKAAGSAGSENISKFFDKLLFSQFFAKQF